MKPKTTLVIIFNHPYIENINKIKKLYEARFDDILFIVPIVRLNEPNVITVYRGSFNFHGYIADTIDFLERRESELYIFCQDDLVMNPNMTPKNFWDTVDFDLHDGFISEVVSYKNPVEWSWNKRVLSRLADSMSATYGSGLENYLSYLPRYEEATALFKKYSLGSKSKIMVWPPEQFSGLNIGASLPYPLAFAFADFFALRRDALRPVVQTLGVFAAMDLFVEVSIGTAMILKCKHMATLADTPWKVVVDWGDRAEIMRRGPRNLNDLHKIFDGNTLFNHPIKLSAIDI